MKQHLYPSKKVKITFEVEIEILQIYNKKGFVNDQHEINAIDESVNELMSKIQHNIESTMIDFNDVEYSDNVFANIIASAKQQ